jgi:hypothetical protein
VNADTQLRESILRSLDPLFAAAGFTRRERSFTWRRKVSTELTHTVHLNFGLYGASVLVNPSVGVRHASVERALQTYELADRSPDRTTFAQMLSVLSGGHYSATVAEGPEAVSGTIWADWCATGRPFVAEVSDLNAAIRRLESPDVGTWCCIGRAWRARLLPVTLATAGRRDEALQWLERLRADMVGRDQAIPPFAIFEERFRTR